MIKGLEKLLAAVFVAGVLAMVMVTAIMVPKTPAEAADPIAGQIVQEIFDGEELVLHVQSDQDGLYVLSIVNNQKYWYRVASPLSLSTYVEIGTRVSFDPNRGTVTCGNPDPVFCRMPADELRVLNGKG